MLNASSGQISRRPLAAAGFLLLLFVLAAVFYQSGNRFPIFYHVDEAGKGRQVIESERNFHHPLLMLTATDLAMRALRIERTQQQAVFTGRTGSAICAALSLSLLALLGW